MPTVILHHRLNFLLCLSNTEKRFPPSILFSLEPQKLTPSLRTGMSFLSQLSSLPKLSHVQNLEGCLSHSASIQCSSSSPSSLYIAQQFTSGQALWWVSRARSHSSCLESFYEDFLHIALLVIGVKGRRRNSWLDWLAHPPPLCRIYRCCLEYSQIKICTTSTRSTTNVQS